MDVPEATRSRDAAGTTGNCGRHATGQHAFEAPTGIDHGAPPQQTPLQLLKRWQDFGATWRVISQTTDSATISMCRCDGGEEVQRLTSSEPELLAWLNGRTSSDQRPQ
jgi:hypothetical protein